MVSHIWISMLLFATPINAETFLQFAICNSVLCVQTVGSYCHRFMTSHDKAGPSTETHKIQELVYSCIQ